MKNTVLAVLGITVLLGACTEAYFYSQDQELDDQITKITSAYFVGVSAITYAPVAVEAAAAIDNYTRRNSWRLSNSKAGKLSLIKLDIAGVGTVWDKKQDDFCNPDNEGDIPSTGANICLSDVKSLYSANKVTFPSDQTWDGLLNDTMDMTSKKIQEYINGNYN